MRRSLTPYAFAAVAMVAALVLLVLSTAPPSQNDDPSSRVAGKAGTLALHDWLGALGFNVHRISGTFDTSGTDVLVIADPRTAITDADADAVMSLLANGGDVVLAMSPESATAAGPLLNRLRVSLDVLRVAGDSVPAQPFDAADRVHHVPTPSGSAIEPAPYLTPLLAQGDLLTAVAEQVNGAGRAYVLASTFPLSNDGLRDEDSAPLVLSLLQRARGGAIGFDEYHHGEADAVASGAWAVFGGPLGLALLLGALAVAVFLAVNSRRIGRPVSGEDAALVPTTGSYITAMAGLYARSSDRGAVATRYAEELKQRLGGGIGTGTSVDDAGFVAAVGAFRPELAEPVAQVLQRARAMAESRPDAASLLSLARDVDDLERSWAQPAAAAPTSPASRPAVARPNVAQT